MTPVGKSNGHCGCPVIVRYRHVDKVALCSLLDGVGWDGVGGLSRRPGKNWRRSWAEGEGGEQRGLKLGLFDRGDGGGVGS